MRDQERQVVGSANPLGSAGVYLADPAARVFEGGERLWVYGSLDRECGRFCSTRCGALSTDDLVHWTWHGMVMDSGQTHVPAGEEQPFLYAPDVVCRDGRYAFFYCLPGGGEGVAFSDRPGGPFEGGKRIDTIGHEEIDPGVFIDDDGIPYYYWGQFRLKMARLGNDLGTLDPESLREAVLTEGEHAFHEGAFLVKRAGTYIFVYTGISRADGAWTLEYAQSDSPFGPYRYGGVILDNRGCNPNNWNNHGSLVAFRDRWYLFYHRSTHGCREMRKTCVEPVHFAPDGSIPEVEMTSQGAGAPLSAFKPVEASRACLLFGTVVIGSGSGDREALRTITPGSRAAYKYLDFGTGARTVSVRARRGRNAGRIHLRLGKPWGPEAGRVDIPAGEPGSPAEETFTAPVDLPGGVQALYLVFEGQGKDLFEVDSFVFSN
jgi:hypothetical protein